VAVAGHKALLRSTLHGSAATISTAWLADADAGTLTFLFDGIPIDLAPSANALPPVTIIGAVGPDRPDVGLIWRNGFITALTGIPVAIDDTGSVVVGTG